MTFTSSSLARVSKIVQHLSPVHNSSARQQTVEARAFRTIHTGVDKDPDTAAVFERKQPIRLDLRRARFEADKSLAYPYTSLLLLEHIFHKAKLLRARHIHLKYVEASGDCYIMFRTPHGLVPYSTVNNRHWIGYLMIHATGKEDPKQAGEGEFRLQAVSDKDGRMEYTVNIVYIHQGVKLTLSPVEWHNNNNKLDQTRLLCGWYLSCWRYTRKKKKNVRFAHNKMYN